MKVIELNHGQVTIVDDDDFEKFAQYRWSYGAGAASKGGTGYAYRSKNSKSTYLHREIINAPKGMQVDHINGNKLDNRKCNLRLATRAQNGANSKIRTDNTTGLKGVCFYESSGKYVSTIMIVGKRTHLGYFTTPEEAKAAYDQAARKHFGEFAKLN